jgi:hypothetical protein
LSGILLLFAKAYKFTINLQISEEELLSKDFISPEDVLRLNKITENYLCPAEANTYGIDFTRYSIDLNTRYHITGNIEYQIILCPIIKYSDFWMSSLCVKNCFSS